MTTFLLYLALLFACGTPSPDSRTCEICDTTENDIEDGCPEECADGCTDTCD